MGLLGLSSNAAGSGPGGSGSGRAAGDSALDLKRKLVMGDVASSKRRV